MSSKHEIQSEIFDRSRLSIKLLAERVHDMHLADVLRLEDPTPTFSHPQFPELARRIVATKRRGAARPPLSLPPLPPPSLPHPSISSPLETP